jgi:hypothetical protein
MEKGRSLDIGAIMEPPSAGFVAARVSLRPVSKAELLAALAPVEGWLSGDEAWALYEMARDAPGPAPVVVEIGSWMGRSTIALALALAERGAGTVVAVDPHAGGYLRTDHGHDSWPAFQANVAAAGVAPYVRPIVARSIDARPQVEGPIDGLFVDGLHRYETAIVDIDTWSDLLRPGATVAFHDVGVFRGYTTAIFERVLAPGPFRRPRMADTTLLVTYRPGPWTRRDGLAAAAARAEVGARVLTAAAGRAATPARRAAGRLRRAARSA